MDAKTKIAVLNGAKEFKQFTSELVRVSRAAGRRKLELEMPMLIMVTESGRGNTTYLRLLTELIREERLLPLSGEEEVFEWRMLSEDEEAVHRLMIRMEKAAGFYPWFSGVIGLDLSDYAEPEDLPRSLFELIRENRKRCLFSLMITEKQAARFLEGLEEKMSRCTRVKTIRLTATDRDLCGYVRNEFMRKGFMLAPDLDDAIRSFVAEEGGSGYRGLRLAMDEILWQKMDRNDGMLSDAKDLESGRHRTGKAGAKKEQKRMIGFGAHEP